METKNNTKTLSAIINEQYGQKGTPKRDQFDKGYQSFKLEALIQEAKPQSGMTAEQLAEKGGTNEA